MFIENRAFSFFAQSHLLHPNVRECKHDRVVDQKEEHHGLHEASEIKVDRKQTKDDAKERPGGQSVGRQEGLKLQRGR